VYGDNNMAQWLDWCVGGTVLGGAVMRVWMKLWNSWLVT
jgi:hypothetical protein